ncbi:MAG: MFS transporter [Candidatus Nanosalina sp.]
MLEIFEDRINRLIGYKALHGVALGLVSIFIPIFIAQQGFRPQTVFAFLLIDVATFMILALPIGYLISRIGVKYSFLFSSLLYVTVFFLLQTVSLNLAVIFTLAAAIGVAKAFHWIPVNAEFTVGSEEDNRGEKYGKLEGIPAVVTPFAPLAGAAVMSFSGFGSLVSISLLFALASILPLMLGDGTEKMKFDLSGLKGLENLDLWILYFLDGFATTAYVFIFPLFVYFAIGGTLNVGGVKTLMAVGSGIFSIVAGKATDRLGREKLLLAGGAISAAVYTVFPILETSFQAFSASFLAGLVYMVYTIPLIAVIADVAEGKNLLGFFSLREVFQGIGKVSVVGLMVHLLVRGSMEFAFRTIFYLSAFSVVLLVWMALRVESSR